MRRKRDNGDHLTENQIAVLLAAGREAVPLPGIPNGVMKALIMRGLLIEAAAGHYRATDEGYAALRATVGPWLHDFMAWMEEEGPAK